MLLQRPAVPPVQRSSRPLRACSAPSLWLHPGAILMGMGVWEQGPVGQRAAFLPAAPWVWERRIWEQRRGAGHRRAGGLGNPKGMELAFVSGFGSTSSSFPAPKA